MKGLLLLALIGIVWFFSPRRWRYWLITPAVVVVVVYLVVTSPLLIALANRGMLSFVPADSGATVDAIVVLGRGEELRNSRMEVAAQLWQAKRAPKIFVSGIIDATEIVELLKAEDIPGRVLSGENCSQNTQENAFFTAAVLRPQGMRKILLVTDPPHMLRSFLVFRNLGFTVISHTSPMPSYLTSKQDARVLLREYLGLVGYTFQGRLNQRDSEPKQPPAEVLEKLSVWNCQVNG